MHISFNAYKWPCQIVYYNHCHFYFEEFGEGDLEYQPFSGLHNACSSFYCFFFVLFFYGWVGEINQLRYFACGMFSILPHCSGK